MKKMIGTLELVGESKKNTSFLRSQNVRAQEKQITIKKNTFFADIEKTYFNCDCSQQFLPKSLNDMHVLLFTNIDIDMA